MSTDTLRSWRGDVLPGGAGPWSSARPPGAVMGARTAIRNLGLRTRGCRVVSKLRPCCFVHGLLGTQQPGRVPNGDHARRGYGRPHHQRPGDGAAQRSRLVVRAQRQVGVPAPPAVLGAAAPCQVSDQKQRQWWLGTKRDYGRSQVRSAALFCSPVRGFICGNMEVPW